jgi:RNA binding exosome subunit
MSVAETSSNDRSQINVRLAELEDYRDEVSRKDHDEVIRLREKIEAFEKRLEKGGERMWAVILIGLGTVAQIAGAIFSTWKATK